MILKADNKEINKILVVGDVMLDQYWHGAANRISPEAPVPVVKLNQIENRVGGAGNVATNIVALGMDAELLSIVGRDDNAKILKNLLVGKNVATKFLGVYPVLHPIINFIFFSIITSNIDDFFSLFSFKNH